MDGAAIMQELGGSQLQTAVSARDFQYLQNGVSFRLGSKPNGIDRVTVTRVENGFMMIFFRGTAQITEENVEQCELHATFTRHIGLNVDAR